MTQITTPDAEADVPLLVAAIGRFLDDRLLEYHSIASKIAYFDAANRLPDHVCEVLVILLKTDINTHQYLWLHSTLALAKVATGVCSAYRRLGDLLDPLFVRATNILRARLIDIFGALYKFLKAWDMEILAEKAATAKKGTLATLLLVREMSDALVYGQQLLDSVADIGILSETLIKVRPLHEFNSATFTTLVSVARAAFFAGQPGAVILLAFSDDPLVSESTAVNILDEHPEFEEVMDFYRYYGYCFVTLSVIGDSINQKYSDLADVFLRVLLKLPNLLVSNYSPVVQNSKLYFSVLDRQELAFFFLLNSLLSYTSLDQYLRVDAQVKTELHYFTTEFNFRISKDLAHQASPSQSYSSSSISVPNLEHRLSPQPTVANTKTLSIILSDGTYKEKVNVVLQFFKSSGAFRSNVPEEVKNPGCLVSFVQLFNISGAPHGSELAMKLQNDALLHCISNIDGVTYPGKILFVDAIGKVVKLLELLSILHLSDTVGLSSYPDAMIAKLFNTGHTFRDLVLVKQLAQFDGRTFKRKYIPALEQDMITSQLSILQRTRDLESCAQKLAE